MEKLKDNRGFTLIELLAVIAILIILTTIAMPSITSLLGRTEKTISKEKEKAFISAAQDYINKNYNTINLTGNSCTVTLEYLHTNGYLSDKSYLDTDNVPYPGGIKYTYDNGTNDKYEYKKDINNKSF